MAKPKKQKIRTSFRKNRQVRTRQTDLTDQYRSEASQLDDIQQHERVSGKGELTRKRTVLVPAAELPPKKSTADLSSASTSPDNPSTSDGLSAALPRDRVSDKPIAKFQPGTVLRSGGLRSTVRGDDGHDYECATRRILKTLSTDQRHVVAAGDRVQFRVSGPQEGIIEQVEPRHGLLCRTSRGRQHVLVANVDLMLIVSSAAEPMIKPHLIDRLLVTSEKAGIRPVICINKIDLVRPADLQPLVGVYCQMGYRVLLLSAASGIGLAPLRELVRNRACVVLGQSGVGKSSLLNGIESGLQLRVSHVSSETQKGRHTTTAAQLIPLSMGGFIVDTPGIRQFQLWDIAPEEVAGFFRDLRPFINGCQFPDCTHTHEADCAVKHGVADGRLDARRYESYCQMLEE